MAEGLFDQLKGKVSSLFVAKQAETHTAPTLEVGQIRFDPNLKMSEGLPHEQDLGPSAEWRADENTTIVIPKDGDIRVFGGRTATDLTAAEKDRIDSIRREL